MPDGKAIVTRFERLWQDSATHFQLCDEMAPFIAPSRVGILSPRAPGTKQNREVFDSTSLMSAELLAMFIASYAMNPAQQWGSHRMKNPAFREDDAINEWLDDCRDRMLGLFADSLFYAEAPESLIDWCGFGTNFLLGEELPTGTVRAPARGFRGMRYEAKRTGRFVIADGPDGLVDTAMEEHRVTADVMQRRWGPAAMPENVRKALAAGDRDKPFTIIHAVYPRTEPDTRYAAGNRRMPWASCWVEKDSKALVHESGYRTFPGAVSRYHRTPGEVWGRGRGHLAFPDTWTLNTAKRMGLEDFALKIRPPMLMRHDAVIGTLRLVPGGPTTVNTHGASIRDVIGPLETGSRPEVSQIKEEELRKSIRQIFFVDQILALMEVNKSEMTAFEFAKKLELLFRLLGPVYGRTEREFLAQVWENQWEQALAANVFAPPPASIFETDGEIQTVFENPIAKAQRAADVDAIALATQDLLPLAQVFPQIWDNYDPDEIVTLVNRTRGVPAKATRSRQERQAFRDARLQQEQQEAALAQAGQIAEAGKNVAPLLTALQGGGRAA